MFEKISFLRGFFKSHNRRILTVDFKGLSVFALDDGVLCRVRRFSAETAGYSEFRQYLADSPESPLYMIVDSVAEDFLIETVAHVKASDSKLLMQRKLEQNYRGGEFRHGAVIGRETTGRRDDKVLFSALTRNQQIEPWIRSILQEEVPLVSITSPAYVLGKYAIEQGYVTSPDVLIINWELTGLRQTYLQEGRTVFSRLTPLQPADDNLTLEQYIMRLSDQSREYLNRIRLLDFDKPLDLHVFTPLLEDDAFADFENNKDYRRIEHHNPEQLLEKESFEGSSEHITAILLCIDYAARKQELGNVYAPLAALRFYHLRSMKQALYVASVVLALIGGAMTVPLLIDTFDRQESVNALLLEINPIQTQYQELRNQFPETPIPSQQMELVVVTKNTILAQTESPVLMLEEISRVVQRDPGVGLLRINWGLVPANPDQPWDQALLAQAMELSVDIAGEFRDASGYRNISARLQTLAAELATIPGVAVSVIALPIIASENSTLNTTVNDEKLNATFTLNLRRGFQL